MKFAHMGDCHLGGWRQPELRNLNFESFKIAVSTCIKEGVDFVLIAGDLFDDPYPPIEILKETFSEFRRLKESKIPVFLIAGSHDYSASGKTFLDVLEKGGFCKNVGIFEEKNSKLYLHPTIYKNVAIYGYPGKKSSLEVDEVNRIRIHDSPGLFKIMMLHTSIKDAVKNLPIKSVDDKKLPKVDYLALAHLHINYCKDGKVYSGPIFPNNISELEELKNGFFYIFDRGKIEKKEIKIRDVEIINYKVMNAFSATSDLVEIAERTNVKNKIVILKLKGFLSEGKSNDIDYKRIENKFLERGAYVLLKSTSGIKTEEADLKIDELDSENIEEKIIKNYCEKNPSKFNSDIFQLIKSLNMEKMDDEKLSVFEERLVSESKKVLEL